MIDEAELAQWAAQAAETVEAQVGEEPEARAALRALAEKGLLGYTVPSGFGGEDHVGIPSDALSVLALCRIRRRLAYASGMLDVMFVEQGLGSYPVARGSQAPWAKELLQRVKEGTAISAFALTEEGAGSDVSGVATRAERSGGGWELNGAKTFITNAGIADFYTVLARTAGEPGERQGLTMFYVPADTPGVRVEPFQVMAPHPIGEVRFENVQVQSDWILGSEGAGMELALANLAQFRTSVAAAATGFSKRAIDESLAHLDQRVQFGRALSSFQGLRFELAEMDVRQRAAELLVEEAAQAKDKGLEAVAEVARAKFYATENASWICDRAVQHLGGLGVKKGHIVERLFREVRALRIYEGTSEVQKLILAKAALQRHRSRSES